MGYAHRSSLSIQINANPLLVCPVRMAESSLVVIRCIRARGMVSGRPDSGVKSTYSPGTNANLIPLDEANNLVCSAANVLQGIPLP